MKIKQLIFVVETTAENKSDDRYISRLIKERYKINDDIKIQYVHMGGKGKFDKKSTTCKINSYINKNKDGENIIIYCFDTDRIDCSQEDKKAFLNEKKYCEKNGFKFIWFNRTIELSLIHI